ncbi:MAG: Flp pilus assembly complex ATPase component TadA [Desulfobulbaceae bacterium]|nr:Flp pilus assembly complex ATPase component TadA [Desulfobulbaceae bacterium]
MKPEAVNAPDNTVSEKSLSSDGSRIGELLLQEGFIQESDLSEALAIQSRERKLASCTIGRILVETGALNRKNLAEVLNHPYLKKSLGTLALEKGMITQDQLDHCLKKQQKDELLGTMLVREGLVEPSQLQVLLREQLDAPKLGEMAIKLGMVTEKDVEGALKIQGSTRPLGEILCDMGVLTPLDLNYILNKHKKNIRLGEYLVKEGILKKEDLHDLLKEHSQGAERFGETLIRKKVVTAYQLQEILAKQYNIPFKSLDGFVYSEKDKKTLSGIISQKYAEKNLIIPLTFVDKNLTLAVFLPEKIYSARELNEIYFQLNISCILITSGRFSELFEVLYSKRLGGLLREIEDDDDFIGSDNLSNEMVDFLQLEVDEEMSSREEAQIYSDKDVEAEELVNYIIKLGITNRASDIHFEQNREGVKLRYRIDGVMKDFTSGWLKKKIHQKASSIVSRIKILSNLDIAERRLPQDGVFRINFFDKTSGEKADLDFRVATCRAIAGENVTIRILDSRKASVGLENLNHAPHVLDHFKRCIMSSAGMNLVTGPTGSGKSSTLYGALKYIYNPSIKIITAEDPIEYNFPGIMQTQVNTKINLTFARLLRSFLRLDPDVIFIGEIRDEETAKIGFDAAQTGHLVLSTLHTNDSISSIDRLTDLKIERGQIASCLSSVIAQRLVRKNCPNCINSFFPEEEEWGQAFVEFPFNLKFYKGKGCDSCNFSGYEGRTLISELYMIDDVQAVSRGAEQEELKNIAFANGMKSMIDDGLLKLRETTLEEIIRNVPHSMLKAFKEKQKMKSIAPKVSIAENGDIIADGFVLSSPETEQNIIDAMHARYQELFPMASVKSTAVNRAIFGNFISDSFTEICRQQHCELVIFTLKEKAGRIDISALPAAE